MAGGNSSAGANGTVYIAPRAYTLTSWYARSRNASDDDYEGFTLYVNASPSTVQMYIPNGQRTASATGLTLAIAAGDELCVLFDPNADNSGSSINLSIHLEPA